MTKQKYEKSPVESPALFPMLERRICGKVGAAVRNAGCFLEVSPLASQNGKNRGAAGFETLHIKFEFFLKMTFKQPE